MIISHKHKFMFFRVPKTASTSMQVFLSQYCEENDFISGITRNFNKKIDKNFYEYIIDNPNRHYMHMYPSKLLKKHPYLKKYWGYKKIVAVRNPWDRYVSGFWYTRFINDKTQDKKEYERLIQDKNLAKKEFHKYAKHYNTLKLANEFYFYPSGGLICNFVVRFENLENDMKKLCEELNIEYKPLISTKSLTRPQNISYQEYYDDEAKEIIREKNKQIIDYFGYSFKETKFKKI